MSKNGKLVNPDDDNRPANIQAEQIILGAMLVEPAAVVDALAILNGDDFSLDSHRRIYEAMRYLAGREEVVQLITVSNELRRRKELDSVGGLPYLYQVSEGLPRKLAIDSYVRIVRDKARLRDLQTLGDRILTEASDASIEASDLLEWANTQLRDLADNFEDQGGLTIVREILGPATESTALAETLQVRDGIPFGIAKLDELTGGAQKSELIIVAARPSMGKTSFLCCTAAHQAIALARHVAVFTAEQKSLAILRRILSGRARIDYQDIRNGTLRAYDRTLLDEHQSILRAAPLFLDERPKPTVTRIRTAAMRLQRELAREGRTLDCILIDQLSKISHADLDRRMPRHERVGEITGSLKALAQEFDIPIILLVQIGREGGKRADRPQLTDLKDSGNIEEDADVVLFPHRPEYYDRDDPSLAGKGEIIIAKQREGPTGVCECLYSGRIMRWEDETIQGPAATNRGIDFGQLRQQGKGYSI